MRFSERYGFSEFRQALQVDVVDEPLRNSLWNALQMTFWDNVYSSDGYRGLSVRGNEPLRALCRRLWMSYFKKPLDTLWDDWTNTRKELRDYFFHCEWYEVYDFLEFVAHGPREVDDEFCGKCNTFLEREASAYRFVSGEIVRIVAPEEIASIEDALSGPDDPIKDHLHRSLELIADRSAADYRNSIKEAISAVEALVRDVTGEKAGTLGELLKKLEEHQVHPALRAAFSKLYGYTSDADGIRHALTAESQATFDDAKFMLVACSAFVGYVRGRLKNGGSGV
jgi:hypothetical protein